MGTEQVAKILGRLGRVVSKQEKVVLKFKFQMHFIKEF